MRSPYDPVELQLSDWRRKGGPGRLDRVAARNPTRFAAVFAATFTLGIGLPIGISAARLGSWWAWAVTAIVLAFGGSGTFVAQRRSAQLLRRAVAEWEDGRNSGPETSCPVR